MWRGDFCTILEDLLTTIFEEILPSDYFLIHLGDRTFTFTLWCETMISHHVFYFSFKVMCSVTLLEECYLMYYCTGNLELNAWYLSATLLFVLDDSAMTLPPCLTSLSSSPANPLLVLQEHVLLEQHLLQPGRAHEPARGLLLPSGGCPRRSVSHHLHLFNLRLPPLPSAPPHVKNQQTALSLSRPDHDLCMCDVVNAVSVTITKQEMGPSGTNRDCSYKERGWAEGITVNITHCRKLVLKCWIREETGSVLLIFLPSHRSCDFIPYCRTVRS